jgi:hypothetical protein
LVNFKTKVNSPAKITRVSIGVNKEDPFVFLGIVSSEPDYTLSLRLNKKTGILLRHSDEEITAEAGNEVISFSKFITDDHSYVLVSNKSEKKCLINKLSKIDFLFISRSDNTINTDDLVAAIRSVEGVTAVFVFNSSGIKDRNIDLVRHLTE